MILFTIYHLFTMNVYDRDGRKKIPRNERTKPRKRFSPFGCPPIPPPIYEMKADCFSVSENTENKPNLP